MSKFSSIALGHSRGSIGNVTTNRLKGQQIAKAKIISTTNVSSVGQVASRGRMSNIVMAWQFLSVFLMFAKGWRKKTESVYNAFVRRYKSVMSDVVEDSRSMAATLLVAGQGIQGNYAMVDGMSGVAQATVVSFSTGGIPLAPGTHIRILGFNSVSGSNNIVDVPLTDAAWASGEYETDVLGADSDYRAAYIYTLDGKKCSNLDLEAV